MAVNIVSQIVEVDDDDIFVSVLTPNGVDVDPAAFEISDVAMATDGPAGKRLAFTITEKSTA